MEEYGTFRPAEGTLADRASAGARAAFIRRTYVHLALAVLAFAGIETFLLSLPLAEQLTAVMTNGMAWLVVLLAFIAVSYIAERWAHSATSMGMQYLGLSVYVVAEAVIFLPLLYVAANYGGPAVIPTAGIVTGCVFAGLTGTAFLSGKNFSFLGPFLGVSALAALGVIVCSLLFGFSLGVFFTGAMIALAGGYILYHTSNVLHEYRIDQHVAASLALFAAVALLFWYILRMLMLSRD